MVKVQFKAKSEDVLSAMQTIAIVVPRAVGSTTGGGGDAGYGFIIRGDKCFVYSRAENHVARASFPVEDLFVEGLSDKVDPAFAFPMEAVAGWKFFSEGYITFEATQEGSSYRVSAIGERKGVTGWRPSFDPRLVRNCDREFDECRKATDGYEFPASVLNHAIGMSKKFHPSDSAKSDDPVCSVEIMNGKEIEGSDGYLFVSNGTQTFSYYSPAFLGKHMQLHVKNVDLLVKFLGKSEGQVRVYEGEKMTFAENSSGQLLGWTRSGKKHPGFGYYDGEEAFVLNVEPDQAVEALNYLQTQMTKTEKKIRMAYEQKEGTGGFLQFQVTEELSNGKGIMSWEVPVRRAAEGDHTKTQFSVSVTIDSLFAILSPISGDSNQISLRVHQFVSNRRDKVMIRTIDDGVKHTVGDTVWSATATRYTPQYG